MEKNKAYELIDRHLDQEFLDRVNVITINNKDEMSTLLSRTEFGFLLRSPAPLNAVASPIKFGEYISCGVAVIISPGVGDYSELVSTTNAGKILDHSTNNCVNLEHNQTAIEQLYMSVFDSKKYVKFYENV
ncbi:hypothetical protein D3C76_1446730 [compost metagenome]